jgi:hypothetical protein
MFARITQDGRGPVLYTGFTADEVDVLILLINAQPVMASQTETANMLADRLKLMQLEHMILETELPASLKGG